MEMERTWCFQKKYFVKIDTHAIHYQNEFPNGNNSGLGVVIRDHRGSILLMVSGSIPGVTARANELWAFLIALRCAYYGNHYKLQIETDNDEAAREWKDWRWFINPNHEGVIQQLLQRTKDPNFKVEEVQVIGGSQNRVAQFLAEDGARNRDRLVAFKRPFGRVMDLWRLDMGLGPLQHQYMVVDEYEFMANMEDEDEDEVQGLGAMVIQDSGSTNMGVQGNLN